MAKVSRKDIALTVIAMAKDLPANKVAKELAAYLVAERRSSELIAILRDIEQMRFRQDGVLEVTAVSAREMTEEAKKSVADLMHAKRVDVRYQTNPDVVGGVRVRALDRQLDTTIAGRLNQLKRITSRA